MAVNLENAKKQFTDLMRNLNKKDQEQFFAFILQEWKPMENIFECRPDKRAVTHDLRKDMEDAIIDDPVFLLNSIAYDIKKRVPFNGILPSEHIETPKKGENSDCDSNVTLHVDEFLYDDDDMNELIDNGKLQKYYCCNCGSRDIKPLIFISHSMSRDALYFIFNTLLPTLEGKMVLDIGSRLGAVLYGAYVYTDASKIIGIEMNKEFCDLQNSIINQYKMNDRIEILHKKIEDAPEVVKASDVVVMNNPFEFYLSESEQIEIWRFLKSNLKKGTILVLRPNIEIMLKHLQTGIVTSDWLKPLPQCQSNNQENSSFSSVTSQDDEEYDNIVCYEIK
ncbi:PREDICTED: uncharacterized protein LOC106789397 [Polistes canadensis]|uniref:uncharacterized protein LOC106789397 n=1 Tax=Polistes canadensis TaxID=91411 RepID=UPI000718D1C3|nr:PREDICTED: uncharacterized protein LOC106789397 [Polistes canadensis]KAI4481986.1 hypothetical protein M0804_009005 [Polistes exclamans]